MQAAASLRGGGLSGCGTAGSADVFANFRHAYFLAHVPRVCEVARADPDSEGERAVHESPNARTAREPFHSGVFGDVNGSHKGRGNFRMKISRIFRGNFMEMKF